MLTEVEAKRIVEERDHVGMISNATLWPWGEVLPLKKRCKPFEDNNMGFVHYSDPCVVYIGLIFMRPSDLSQLPKKTYDSIQAVVDDGWMVD